MLPFNFCLSLILNVVGNVPFDWPSKSRTTPESEDFGYTCLLWFIGGCLLAGLSLLIFKHSLIESSGLRITNLALAPLTSAFISEAIAKRRSKMNPFIIPRNHFWQAFWFTLGLVVIRFAYTARI